MNQIFVPLYVPPIKTCLMFPYLIKSSHYTFKKKKKKIPKSIKKPNTPPPPPTLVSVGHRCPWCHWPRQPLSHLTSLVTALNVARSTPPPDIQANPTAPLNPTNHHHSTTKKTQQIWNHHHTEVACKWFYEFCFLLIIIPLYWSNFSHLNGLIATCESYVQRTDLLKQIGLELSKWVSSSKLEQTCLNVCQSI